MSRLRVFIALSLLACVSTVWAWHQEGHQSVSQAAAIALPADVPAFLREGAMTIAHCSVDPDLVRTRPMTQLSAADTPNHYFDLELVQVDKLPDSRYDFIASLLERDLKPGEVGLGLYALAECRQKLTVALAEHRKWPQNKAIMAKCLVYAGELSHYAADLSQPLHTTIHFDGKANESGRSPRSGIHEKVDDLLRLLPADMRMLPADFKPERLPGDLPTLVKVLQSSHALVERVYELEPQLPESGKDQPLPAEVLAFAKDRFDASAALTSSLIYSAWLDSEDLKLPGWLTREEE